MRSDRSRRWGLFGPIGYAAGILAGTACADPPERAASGVTYDTLPGGIPHIVNTLPSDWQSRQP